MVKTKRATIESVTLINWNGIAGQTLQLHELLTALEGGNGAGKTTTMAAIYLVLMPDLSLVKILNVGETHSSRSDTGLHGRIGQTGVCYSILEFRTPRSERIFAGVQVLPKSAPHLEISGLFVISDLPEHLGPTHIFTAERDGRHFVPDLPQIHQNTALYGGQFTQYKTVSDYGNRLFDLGIAPIKYTDHRFRNDFNSLLQSCMHGNFSSKLRERLKDYLLAEDKKINDNVERMQQNLNRCRQTRHLLTNLRRKIEVVKGVQDSASDMIQAALSSFVLQHREHAREEWSQRCTLAKARKTLKVVEASRGQLQVRIEQLAHQYDGAQKETQRTDQILSKARKANEIQTEIAKLEKEIADLDIRINAAQEEHALAQRNHTHKKERLDGLNAQWKDIVDRISSAQTAWEKISEEAGLYRSARKSLSEVQEAMPRTEIRPENCESLLQGAQHTLKMKVDEFHTLQMDFNLAQANRSAFDTALSLLTNLCEEDVPPEQAHLRAKMLESEFAAKVRLVEENQDLEKRIAVLSEKSARQKKISAAMVELERHGLYIKTANDLVASHQQLIGDFGWMKEDLSVCQRAQERLKGEIAKDEISLGIHKEKATRWEKADQQRTILEQKNGVALQSRAQVEALVQERQKAYRNLLERLSSQKQEAEKIHDEIESLVRNQDSRDPRLETIAEALGGRLASSLYEHIPLEQAADQEARLGPMVNAIMVNDLSRAVESIDSMKNVPEEIWLLEKGPLDDHLRKLKKLSNAILAPMGERTWRITQFPKFPIVGSIARKKRIETLREEHHQARQDILDFSRKVKEEEAEVDAAKDLLTSFQILESSNPRPEVERAEGELQKKRQTLPDEAKRQREIEAGINETDTIAREIAPWISSAGLLDEPDHEEDLTKASARLESIVSARREVSEKGEGVRDLRTRISDLTILPMNDTQIKEREGDLSTLEKDCTFWQKTVHLLEQLLSKIDHLAFEESYRQLQQRENPTEALERRKAEIEVDQARVKEELEPAWERFNETQENLSEVRGLRTGKQETLTDRRAKLEEIDCDGSEQILQTALSEHAAALEAKQNLEMAKKEAEDSLSAVKEKASNQKSHVKELESYHGRAFKALRVLSPVVRHARRCAENDATLAPLWRRITDSSLPPFESAAEADAKASEYLGIFRATISAADHQEEESGARQERRHAERLLSLLDQSPAPNRGESARLTFFLEVWLETADYIAMILPRDTVHTDDTTLALQQMEERQRTLEDTLAEHEESFRSDSDMVADSIHQRIRQEQRKISDITARLRQVSFGSVAGIEIEFTRNKSLLSLLEAMKNKEQFELFNQDIPLHEAMEKVYYRISGSKVQGDKLLDYRNYIDLDIYVLRKSGARTKPDFSTGEAIGVGAAVMIVILGSWEGYYSFSRSSKELAHSIRFLMMDEATRLDSSSINTLLDFARRMQVQLMIAAPSFLADEASKGITYTLTRQYGNKKEKVVFAARRGFTTEENLAETG